MGEHYTPYSHQSSGYLWAILLGWWVMPSVCAASLIQPFITWHVSQWTAHKKFLYSQCQTARIR